MATSIQAEFRAINKNGKTCVIIVDNIGFSYSFHNRGKANQTCRCTKRLMKKCSAQIIIQEGWIISHRNSHNHDPPEDLYKTVPVKLEYEIVQKYFKGS